MDICTKSVYKTEHLSLELTAATTRYARKSTSMTRNSNEMKKKAGKTTVERNFSIRFCVEYVGNWVQITKNNLSVLVVLPV